MSQQQEAFIIAYYLVKQPITQEVADAYITAIKHHPVVLNGKQERIWQFGLKHKLALSCIDSALALDDRYNDLRKKIFIMLAILETRPEYAKHFLPKRTSAVFFASFFLRLLLAPIKYLTGKILLWVI